MKSSVLILSILFAFFFDVKIGSGKDSKFFSTPKPRKNWVSELKELVEFKLTPQGDVVAFALIGNDKRRKRTTLIKHFGLLSKEIQLSSTVTVQAMDLLGTIQNVEVPGSFLVKASLFPNPMFLEIEAKLATAPTFLKKEAAVVSQMVYRKENAGGEIKKAVNEAAEKAWTGVTQPEEQTAQTQASRSVATDDGNNRTFYPANFNIQRWRYQAQAEIPYTNDPEHTLFITDNFSDNQVAYGGGIVYGPFGSDWPQKNMRSLARPDRLNYLPLGAEEIQVLDQRSKITGNTRGIELANYLCERAENFAKTQLNHHISTIVSAGHSNYVGIGLFNSMTGHRDDNAFTANNHLLKRFLTCVEEHGITVGEWRALGCNSGTKSDEAISNLWNAPRTLAYGLNGKKGSPTKVWVIDGRAGFFRDGAYFKILNVAGVQVEGDMVEISRRQDEAISDTLIPVVDNKGKLIKVQRR